MTAEKFRNNHPAAGLYNPSTERDACGVGLVVQLDAAPNRKTVLDALQILVNLEHRGACCGDFNGDGAGLLLQIPDRYFRSALASEGVILPEVGKYAVGMLFLPRDERANAMCRRIVQQTASKHDLELLALRSVPVDSSVLTPATRKTEPEILQLFVRPARLNGGETHFSRTLYLFRKELEKRVESELPDCEDFHIPSLSNRTIVYKGLLLAPEIERYFLDLQQSDFCAAFALVHQRYSTNTLPSWRLAHPFRYLCHNGEINTLRGNLNWHRAREPMLAQSGFGAELSSLFPLIPEGLSDSASLDAMLELLVQGGRSLPHAMTMLLPEAWEKHATMSAEKRAFYEYHSCLMEPWDGPALVVFTDGKFAGATLDRNGLRPARYLLTSDGRVVLASEAGALEVPAAEVVSKGRIEPGKMLLIDLERGRIISDDEVKSNLARAYPYSEWLESNLIPVERLAKSEGKVSFEENGLLTRQRICGYTAEDLNMIITPMAEAGEEPIGSMGADIPLAVFSERPLLLFDYFKQLFAQVTNPPLDAIRESLVTSTFCYLGGQGNLFCDGADHVRRIKLNGPVLSDEELASIQAVTEPGLKTISLSSLVAIQSIPVQDQRGTGLEHALDRLCELACASVASGYNILVLSDRGADKEFAPIPALLACSAVHHALIRAGKRSQCSIIVESAEPREVHHVALLLGYGASAVNPYLALASIRMLHRRSRLRDGLTAEGAKRNYLSALTKGVVKVMSKIGISVLQSYTGAQIFEAIGLGAAFVERYFPGTASRIGGIGLGELAQEIRQRHAYAITFDSSPNVLELEIGGEYQWRRQGEKHLNNPLTVAKLQHAVRNGKSTTFQEYSALVNEQNRQGNLLRGLLEFLPSRERLALDEVEPAKEIVKRFRTGAMSFGSISFEAHANLALAMNRIGGRSNSGEGGEDPLRDRDFDSIEEFRSGVREASEWVAAQLKEGDSLRSGIRQVASARFGVTSEYLAWAKEIQIKIAQGAKPGEGGQLPGHKVDPWIARVRHSLPGVQLISPPPHHDIYSIEDLAELIYDLKSASPEARISVKLVSEVGVGTIAAGVAKAKADAILISGADGGTGASPLSSIKHAGLPWELGLAEAHQVLLRNGLRDFVVLETDGQLKTGRDVAIACLLGAEEFGFSTAPMIAQGCVMMRKCHLNTCPVGIATQDPELRKKFTGRPEHVINFMFFVAEELRVIMSQLGFRTVDEMVGRVDRLSGRKASEHTKARNVSLDAMLSLSGGAKKFDARKKRNQNHRLEKSLDSERLMTLAAPVLADKTAVFAELPIKNTHRAVGAQVGCAITQKWGPQALEHGTFHVRFLGSAGQSFGAFVPQGMTLEVEGDVNDYCGKGLSGGVITIRPPAGAAFRAEEQVIAGNVAFYGATSGWGFVRGKAGERFAVRNSGAQLVVEGIGEHGCEYMTGGKVMVLGRVGRNFAAGMSGGIAYVYDPEARLHLRCNHELVVLDTLNENDSLWVLQALEQHALRTGSTVASGLLSEWERQREHFVRVIPVEYRRALEEDLDIETEGARA